ncbi:MAG: hypothetical protein KAR14_15285 [Candidatus Aminicenantes bacterium]|nr:hypothetical protein [Candidatus Aminicenantes bacterium]
MKKIIILISIMMMITGGLLLSNENRIPVPIPASKIMEISGKIQAVMTDIPAGQVTADGLPPKAFTKIKVKDPATGQEHSIQIAPGHYLRLKGVILRKDDQIRIKGFKPDNSIEIKSMEIEVKGKILILRDQFGKGAWEKPNLRPKRTGFKVR